MRPSIAQAVNTCHDFVVYKLELRRQSGISFSSTVTISRFIYKLPPSLTHRTATQIDKVSTTCLATLHATQHQQPRRSSQKILLGAGATSTSSSFTQFVHSKKKRES